LWGAEAISHCGGFSCYGAQAPGHMDTVVMAQGLQRADSVVVVRGLVSPQHVGSSCTRDQTGVPCIARWILNHWTTREAHAMMTIICPLFIQYKSS